MSKRAFDLPKYTQIPDSVFDYWMPILSGAEFKVLCYIARRTFGFRKYSDSISLSQIAEGIAGLDGGTGVSKRGTVDVVASLEKRGLVTVKRHSEDGQNSVNQYSLSLEIQEPEEGGGSAISSLPPSAISSLGGSAASSLGVVNSVHQQETVLQQTEEEPPTPTRNFASLNENQNPPALPEPAGYPTLDKFKVDPAAPFTERPGIDPAELCLEDPIEAFAKNAYRRRPGAKLENLHTQRNVRLGGLVPRLTEAESEMGPADFRLALLAYLKTEDEWRLKNQWPIQGFLKNPSKWAIQQSATARKGTPSAPQLTVAQSREVPDGYSSPTLPERWNVLIPEHPVDPEFYLKSGAYSNPQFAARFDEVCASCRKLIAGGGDVNFATLLRHDKDRDVYGWQKILAGEFSWMLKKKAGTKQEETLAKMDMGFWMERGL